MCLFFQILPILASIFKKNWAQIDGSWVLLQPFLFLNFSFI